MGEGRKHTTEMMDLTVTEQQECERYSQHSLNGHNICNICRGAAHDGHDSD